LNNIKYNECRVCVDEKGYIMHEDARKKKKKVHE